MGDTGWASSCGSQCLLFKLVKVAKGKSVSTQWCLTPCDPVDRPHQAPLSMGFPGKNTRAGCHYLLQGIFSTQGSNRHLLCLLNYRQILYPCKDISKHPYGSRRLGFHFSPLPSTPRGTLDLWAPPHPSCCWQNPAWILHLQEGSQVPSMQRSYCTFGFNSPNSFAHFAVTMR